MLEVRYTYINVEDVSQAFFTRTTIPALKIGIHLCYQLRVSASQEFIQGSNIMSSALVIARRHDKWMIYSLPEKASAELDLQLRGLKDCVQSNPLFGEDLKRLKR